jgi:hypothetical protein
VLTRSPASLLDLQQRFSRAKAKLRAASKFLVMQKRTGAFPAAPGAGSALSVTTAAAAGMFGGGALSSGKTAGGLSSAVALAATVPGPTGTPPHGPGNNWSVGSHRDVDAVVFGGASSAAPSPTAVGKLDLSAIRCVCARACVRVCVCVCACVCVPIHPLAPRRVVTRRTCVCGGPCTVPRRHPLPADAWPLALTQPQAPGAGVVGFVAHCVCGAAHVCCGACVSRPVTTRRSQKAASAQPASDL